MEITDEEWNEIVRETKSGKRRHKRDSVITKSIPYASATSGTRAREETTKILRRLGCESIGFMDELEKHEVFLAFKHRGREVQLRASAKGWAQAYLKQNPWNYSRRKQRVEYEQDALRQGQVAVNSVLRDWVKGQVTAIETGILSFEAVFAMHMLTHDDRPLIERVTELLPKPEPDDQNQKIVALPAR